jgi:hypothetical protein
VQPATVARFLFSGHQTVLAGARIAPVDPNGLYSASALFDLVALAGRF